MMESPRLRELLHAARARGSTAVDEFWDEIIGSGTPLIEPGRELDRRLVTLLWREREPIAGVYALVNRLTDKGLVADGMMRRLPDTDVWFVTFDVLDTLRSSYRFYPFGERDRFFGSGVLAHLDAKALMARTVPDPRNPGCGSGRGFGSVLELPSAPSLAEWKHMEARPAGTLSAHDFTTARGADTYRIRQYIPAGPIPAGGLAMLVLLDAQRWFDDFNMPAAIDAAIRAGRCSPVGIIGVESPAAPQDRMRQLGADPQFVQMLADELIPFAESSGVRWAGRERRMLCGQSLGGLTALAAALWTPEAYGAVLAQSPSVWWRPDGSVSPHTYTDSSTSWLFERFGTAAVGPVRILIDAGSNEGLLTEHLHRFQDMVSDRGFRSRLQVYTGGHDYPCWAAAMMSGLAELCGATPEDAPSRRAAGRSPASADR
ncbi:alpha/beta hydrolase-fold protein [Nocardia sp. IFM 10818]